jgi:two-component system sensor histidine kinase UhpB
LQAPDQITVPEAYEVTLFRILQEALTNVRRHSAATQVAIGLVLADGELRLTVTDDGRGLPADLAASGGLGLATMRQRVEALGGRLALTAASPGTRVEVTVPAPPEEPE